MVLWTPIPGETPIDASGLKILVTTRSELNVAEAKNIRKAMAKYLVTRPNARKAPFDMPWALRLHREMFGNVWTWAGKPRDGSAVVNIGVPSYQVEPMLLCLLEDVKRWPTTNMTMLEQAATLHHRAVKIHPFRNGNGRWSRLLANIWLRRHGHEVIEWLEGKLGEQTEERGKYLAAIASADDGDCGPLMKLQERFVT